MKLALILALAAPTLALAGCVGGDSAFDTEPTARWKERLEATPEAFILDVRTPQEYAAGHIPNSTLIPHTDIQVRADELPPDKSTPIFVYCRSGSRSTAASATLAELGYTNIVNMRGGFPDWARAGYPTQTGPPL